jgi:hypothetical protein
MRIHLLLTLCVGVSSLNASAADATSTRPAEAAGSGRALALGLLEKGESPVVLEQVVATLGALPDVTPAELGRVAEVSRKGADERTQISAIHVMQKWLARESLRTNTARELIQTAQGRHTPMVRGLAVQALALQPNAVWPADVVVSLGKLVQDDPTAQNRAIAALALGQVRGELAGVALKSMVTAYARESDVTTRRSMLLNLVEAAGGDAAKVLARLPESSALVRQDIQDYQEILRTGETRIGEIWNKKLARDIERGSVIGTEEGHDRE